MKKINWKYTTLLTLATLLNSCATEKAQYGKSVKNFQSDKRQDSINIAHTFYLIGDAGNADQPEAQEILELFKNRLKTASTNSTILFLGDNIYPNGLPLKNNPKRKEAESIIDKQLALVEDFKGQKVFIPGNHDWYSEGILGLKEQQEYLFEKTGNKNIFLPKNQCAIDTKKIGQDIAVIYIDSQWFLSDWEKNPGINENCEIKTREDFFTEFEDQLNKNQNRTIIIAIHHPLLDNGSHGGKFSIKKQLFPFEGNIPLPGVASLINLIRTTGGLSSQDLNNPNYQKLASRIKTLIADKENIVVVSGHDHNLQYINKQNIHQIISGAGSKKEAAAAISKNDFSYGKNGYAQLEIHKDGSAKIMYFGNENKKEKLLFEKTILDRSAFKIPRYPSNFPITTTSTVYEASMTKKSSLYKSIWGNNYRRNYATPITVPTLQIDTLFGGAKPTRMGGGHQTNSLRLETNKGEYVIRAIKKSGSRFLQSVAFKDNYITNDVTNTFADRFLLDFYTSSHPYTSLAVAQLSNTVDLPHTNPKLVYVPKQKGLEKYNEFHGDQLYFLEIRPTETEENPNAVLSTEDVLKLLQKDEKYRMDEQAYIRARLFDILIGDWDRHSGQWKFTQTEKDGLIYFSPIPKDRDQAFAKYDGILTNIIMTIPALRHMQTFKKDIRNIKWFNREPYPLDLAFTKNSTLEDWKKEATFLQERLTQQKIEESFNVLPKEVQNEDIEIIKKNLASRKLHLSNYATEYYDLLQRNVPLIGTNKKDKFIINRLPNNETEVKIIRTKKTGEELVFHKNYKPEQTKELWLYGLGDDDQFIINGNSNKPIQLRLLGGWNNDIYDIQSNRKIVIYDYQSKNNTFKGNSTKTVLTDDYNLNEYNYHKPYYNVFGLIPNLGFNPDDGVTIGAIANLTLNGFKRNPFTAKHSLKANYLTGSGGYELGYSGIFPRISGNWFYQVDADFSSSKFIRNFYGLGNESKNDKEIYEHVYYRVRAQNFKIAPTINWQKNAAHLYGRIFYENIKIEHNLDRYIGNNNDVTPEIFKTQHYGGAVIGLKYHNLNNKVNPTLGMKFDSQISYEQNLNDKTNKLPKIEVGLGFIHYLTNNEKLTLSTYAKAKWLLSNHFEFYQMATLGGNDNLRGFRFDRFYGKNSFYQTTDLKLALGTIQNSFMPINIGIFGGFDYGRVWLPNEKSDTWHNSFGGGLTLNVLEQIGLQGSYFYSKDGGRIVVGLNVNF